MAFPPRVMAMMRAARFVALVTALTAVALTLPAGAGAVTLQRTSPVILLGTHYPGTILHINSTGPAIATRRSNPLTGAEGFLGPVAPDCPFVHYHGRLFGRPDPAPNACGWGQVILARQASEVLYDIAKAIDSERDAEVSVETDAFGDADHELIDALHRLDDAIFRLNTMRERMQLTAEELQALQEAGGGRGVDGYLPEAVRRTGVTAVVRAPGEVGTRVQLQRRGGDKLGIEFS